MPDIDKVIVTNLKALRTKYGDRTAEVEAAIESLIKQDEDRGLTTVLVDLADPSNVGVPVAAVKDPTDVQAVKQAIDNIHRALVPDYVLLLGSSDVIPHQSLENPMAADRDPDVPSDLPYACEHGFSRLIADFIAPTRVVGRIPDLTGATDPAYIIELLGMQGNWDPISDAAEPGPHFGLSAAVWSGSTTLSLQHAFGHPVELHESPPGGPAWPTNLLGRYWHFINCHGAPADPYFYGEGSSGTVRGHSSAVVAAADVRGVTVAAECCYGAELYDPELTGGEMGICQTYLGGGGYGFFGSTNIAYGPADSNANADLITQFFHRSVRGGASLGRAALEARQAFVQCTNIFDAADLKTLGQFVLLGDPSIHPVTEPIARSFVGVAESPKAKTFAPVARQGRRDRLLAAGLALTETASVVREVETSDAASGPGSGDLLRLAGLEPRGPVVMKTFTVPEPLVTRRMKAAGGVQMARDPERTTVQMVVSRPEGPTIDVDTLADTFAVIAHVVNGEVESWRTLFAR